ncbi:MAG: cell division protein FtsA [Rhodospirillaceae bacterium]|jgi:cell division protein FtsA|nr:cell division protein FtsA [Rhodospirillaceae bacterium]MBT4589488.1 cell division protein FtsA [Rhodospirillaceae bacterium]MBT4937635.1 cell division protein FtsA [Rhodospirillaceae bacterium]MBT7268242.1 cell division protein FtsA [Rhodospirillaceae bacterium]
MIQNTPSKSANRTGLITALDVGTTKVACFIARPLVNGAAEVIGVGHQVSKGIKNGNIVDMAAVEDSIRTTVEAAEHMAGENVRDVVLCVSGSVPESKLISFDVAISGHEISEVDLKRALDPTWLYSQQVDDRQIIHTLPVAYSIDGNPGVKDPRGMYGEKLGVNMHVITASAGALRNITACVNRCHLDVESQVVGPYAAGLSCLVEDEKELGVICIDMGGGTTDLSVFFDGEIVYTDSVPLGGNHVTNDIARGLSTPVAYAERMKTLYGSAVPSPSDDQEVIKVPLVGEEDDGENQISRSMLVGIIRPRIEEIFELVREKLEPTGFEKAGARRVVLTGGASQLTGVRELAAEMMDKQVRLGRPNYVKGLAESVNGPAFSAPAGLIQVVMKERKAMSQTSSRTMDAPNNKFGRIGKWIRENI